MSAFLIITTACYSIHFYNIHCHDHYAGCIKLAPLHCIMILFLCSDFKSHNFTMIFFRYSHGENVKGAYHCRFGVVKKGTTPGQKMMPEFIKGLKLTGSVSKEISFKNL